MLYAASIRLTATTFVAGISLGIMTSLYTVCMYHLIRNLVHSTGTTRRTVRLTAWITALWTFSSISTIANAYCTIYAYAWQLDYPGGPATYLAVRWNKPVPILAYVTYIVTTWLADALMVRDAFAFASQIGGVSQARLTTALGIALASHRVLPRHPPARAGRDSTLCNPHLRRHDRCVPFPIPAFTCARLTPVFFPQASRVI